MTTTERPTLPTLAETRERYVSPAIAQRRANGIRPGRALSPRELDDLAALFPDLHGATNVNDLDEYQQMLLGVRGPSTYEQQQIDAAEDRTAQPWSGGFDRELASRRDGSWYGRDASDQIFGRGATW